MPSHCLLGDTDTTGVHGARFDSDGFHKLLCSLKQKIGPHDAHWRVFDFTEKEDPIQGSLAGDLSEIYFDLKQSISLEGTGASTADVLFDWRLDFPSHWDRHLLGAVTAIHHNHIE